MPKIHLKRILSFLFICFYLIFAEAQTYKYPEEYIHNYDNAFKFPYPKRWDMIDSIRTNLYSTKNNSKEDYLFRIKILELAAKKHHDEKAMLISEVYKMDYLQQSSHVPLEEFEKWYFKSIAEATRLEFDEIKFSIAYHYSSFLSTKYQKDALSLYYLNKSIEFIKAAKSIREYKKGYTFSGISNIYYKYKDYKKAIYFGRKSEKYPKDNAYVLFTLDVIGMSYLNEKMYDSALYYFNKDLRLYQTKIKHTNAFKGWEGILKGNKAHVFKAMGQMDSAIVNYKIGIENTYKHSVLDNTCDFAINLADIYLNQKNLIEVEKWLPLAIKTTQSNGNETDKLKLNQLLTKYYTAKGNFKVALQYKDSVHKWSDSLDKRIGRSVKIQAELILETEKRNNTENNLKESLYNQKKNLVVSLVIIVLLLLVATAIGMRQRLLTKLKQQEAQNEKALAVQQMHEFTQIIITKNQQIELLLSQSSGADYSESIAHLQTNMILTDEQWNDFKVLFEKVHKGYLKRLKEKIPSITPAEVRFMALAKLQLDAKEMGVSLGISANAVRNTWYRLRKKVGFTDTDHWDKLVEII